MLKRPPLLCRCGIALALAFITGQNLPAQQVATIDLTQVTGRTELRRPPAPAGTPDGSSGAQDIHGCPDYHRGAGILRTTLVSLDRPEYKIGDEVIFEVMIENIGSVPVRIPFSPHLADFQSEDPKQKFGYLDLSVVLLFGGRLWKTTAAGGEAKLYGSDGHPGTVLDLKPGEWVRITEKGKIGPLSETHVVGHPSYGDAIDHANAQVTLARTETMVGARTIASVSNVMCVISRPGPDVPIKVKELEQSSNLSD